jgi:ABC-2 type transport system permease protein
MKITFEIARKELRTLLFSPIGWLILAVISMQAGTMLFQSLSSRATIAGFWENILSLTYALMFVSYSGIVPKMLANLYLFVPLITMGLLSQEFANGTIKLLFSSPVKAHQIVLGKYLSVMIYALLLAALVVIFEVLIGLFIVQSMDIKVAFWGVVAVYLMVCLYASVGLFVSSLTSYPFIAALGSVGLLFGLQYLSGLVVVGSSMPPVVSRMLEWFSVLTMFGSPSFIGYITAWQLLYFPIVIGLFLGLTWLRLYSMRHSEPLWTRMWRYVALIVACVAIGMASVPVLRESFFNVRSDNPKDTRILVGRQDLMPWRTTLMYGISGVLLVVGGTVVLRRRRR